MLSLNVTKLHIYLTPPVFNYLFLVFIVIPILYKNPPTLVKAGLPIPPLRLFVLVIVIGVRYKCMMPSTTIPIKVVYAENVEQTSKYSQS
jgi:hypothetical protein